MHGGGVEQRDRQAVVRGALLHATLDAGQVLQFSATISQARRLAHDQPWHWQAVCELSLLRHPESTRGPIHRRALPDLVC